MRAQLEVRQDRVGEMLVEAGLITPADLNEAVSEDPAIAAKLLKVANSAVYGFSHQVDNVPLAVSLLGLVETYSIVVSVYVIKVFERSRAFDYKRFWMQSMACAHLARALAPAVPGPQRAGISSAGLLHDRGCVALLQIAPRHYERVDPALAGRGLIEEEERLLGLTHTEAGYELAVHWALPPELAECIRLHHTPEYASEEHRPMVSLINVTDVAARAYGGNGGRTEIDLTERAAGLNFLGLSEDQVREVIEAVPEPTASESLWAPG